MSSKKRGYSDAERAAYYKSKYASAAKVGSAKAPKYKAKAKAAKAAERSTRYRPPGLLSDGGGALGALAGGALGGPAGAAIGKMLGGKLGHIVEHITGFGDYQVSQNSIMHGMMQPAAVVNSVDRGCIIVRHREYIGDINSTSAFTLAAYPINPGMAVTFPWLSGIAQNFEQYRMRGCLFEFLSTSSDAILAASSSASLGTVNMATEYDSLESSFSSKREMLNHEFANSRKPSLSFIHPIECKKSRTAINEQYIRNTSIPVNADLRLYDLGKFQIATEGMQAATGVCGELWVTYEVELFKAKYETTYVNDGVTDHYKLNAPTNAQPLGASATLMPGSTLGGSIGNGSNTYGFPTTVAVGDRFLVSYSMSGTNTAVISYPAITYQGCSASAFFGNGQSTFYSPPVTSTSSTIVMLFNITITGQNASLTWNVSSNIPTTSTVGDLIVTQVQTGLTGSPQVVELEDDEVETPMYSEEYVKQLEEQVQRLRKLERKPTV